jgi:uncharacterized protein (DUF58 family)
VIGFARERAVSSENPAIGKQGRTFRLRRRLRVTREGKVFVFVSVGLGFAAVNTGTNLMYLVFGFMLSVIVLSGILSEQTLRKLRVSRLLPATAIAGQPVSVEVEVTSEKPRGTTYSLEIREAAPVFDPPVSCFVLQVAAGQTERGRYRCTFPTRGRVALGAMRVATRFPFALFEKYCLVESPAELIVYPKPRGVVLSDLGAFGEGEGLGEAPGRGVETRELRDYRSGDEARAVHWMRSAAMGRPIVRELQREAAPAWALHIDNYLADPRDQAALGRLERDVSRAAFLVGAARLRRRAVVICARGTSSAVLAPGAAEAPLLAFLALLTPVTVAAPYALPAIPAKSVMVGELVDVQRSDPDEEPTLP